MYLSWPVLTSALNASISIEVCSTKCAITRCTTHGYCINRVSLAKKDIIMHERYTTILIKRGSKYTFRILFGWP